MLILTRRAGEKLMIGDDIEVTVLSVNGRQVRLGINAEKDVAIHREEIYHQIKQQENKETYHANKNDDPSSSGRHANHKDRQATNRYRPNGS